MSPKFVSIKLGGSLWRAQLNSIAEWAVNMFMHPISIYTLQRLDMCKRGTEMKIFKGTLASHAHSRFPPHQLTSLTFCCSISSFCISIFKPSTYCSLWCPSQSLFLWKLKSCYDQIFDQDWRYVSKFPVSLGEAKEKLVEGGGNARSVEAGNNGGIAE